MSSTEVRYWPGFEDALARLRRKYPRIDQDIKAAFEGGLAGRCDPLPGYAHKLWKYRVASRDMQRGKQGGFRIIFYMEPGAVESVVYLLAIYAKSERSDVSKEELLGLWTRFLDYLRRGRG